jgi:hypothetical protein
MHTASLPRREHGQSTVFFASFVVILAVLTYGWEIRKYPVIPNSQLSISHLTYHEPLRVDTAVLTAPTGSFGLVLVFHSRRL